VDKRYISEFENILHCYQNESSHFIHDTRILNRNKLLKLVTRVNALRFNLQWNDLEISFYNELKTFLLVNTRLYHYHKSIKRYLPITELGIKKRAFAPGWFKYRDLLYHSTHDMRYRTIITTVKKKQFLIPAFIRRVRPLNKDLVYNIATTSFTLSLRYPLYVVKKRKSKSRFSILYLGFKFQCHIRKKKRKRLLKRTLWCKLRRNRKKKRSRYKRFHIRDGKRRLQRSKRKIQRLSHKKPFNRKRYFKRLFERLFMPRSNVKFSYKIRHQGYIQKILKGFRTFYSKKAIKRKKKKLLGRRRVKQRIKQRRT